MTESQPPIRSERRGHIGRITLDRPRQLNAIDIGMARAIMSLLETWRDDDDVRRIVIDSASERAFCAGGDIKRLYGLIGTDGAEVAYRNMVVPYEAMLAIAHYPKPVVTLMDGIAMGGGIGVGAHARHRVVTERSVLAMPETIIGLTPDAGGSWLLARAPSASEGLRHALTGQRMSGAQAMAMGFADHLVSSERLGAVREALAACEDGEEEAVLRGLAEMVSEDVGALFPAGSAALYDIAIADPHEGLPELLKRLEAVAGRPGYEWAEADLEILRQVCPFSLCVTWRVQQEQRLSSRSLDEAFALEMRAVRCLVARPDFAEGVRARVVDKDNAPRWSPSVVAEVDPALVERCLA
ncbi:enoyl-CoA hydratase/isomerase family protein [Acetobacter conturbans]|uniref:3-hydroxyisobutyryl-CoA hydrolase n=1 Tax=Acetobacter conturbans TaxID=1737472 RepID=A0ABX0JV38_9PROT|nr:enoyl-CoA hydratase/isomerase family protein [Acetobacter conturbans]NHN87086.1 enoyl-CoA hydratase/isomerase family protein [Acetobacter conturbans]